jgi:hypothetical protein
MNTPPDGHARHIVATYSKEVPDSTVHPHLLETLIVEQIHKALSEDREALRAMMPCDDREPCAFDNVCTHHKAFAASILSTPLVSR